MGKLELVLDVKEKVRHLSTQATEIYQRSKNMSITAVFDALLMLPWSCSMCVIGMEFMESKCRSELLSSGELWSGRGGEPGIDFHPQADENNTK